MYITLCHRGLREEVQDNYYHGLVLFGNDDAFVDRADEQSLVEL